MSDAIVLTKVQIDAFKSAVAALALAAAPLARIDKSKLDDSDSKFLVIRAVRADHLAREVSRGKSLRS